MTTINLDEYVSAGYFLILKGKRPHWLDEPAGLVLDEILSLECAFCEKLHVGWGWTPGNFQAALDFGIPEVHWEDFRNWCGASDRHDIEVWSMFRSTDAVRRFIAQFIPEDKRDGLVIVGAGVHEENVSEWEGKPFDSEGVELRIPKRLPMEPGGEFLGFDVSSYAHHNFDHTWFSHGHHHGVFQDLGIRPGPLGLIQTREDAIRARQYTSDHDSYDYEYFLLLSYPLALPESPSE